MKKIKLNGAALKSQKAKKIILAVVIILVLLAVGGIIYKKFFAKANVLSVGAFNLSDAQTSLAGIANLSATNTPSLTTVFSYDTTKDSSTAWRTGDGKSWRTSAGSDFPEKVNIVVSNNYPLGDYQGNIDIINVANNQKYLKFNADFIRYKIAGLATQVATVRINTVFAQNGKIYVGFSGNGNYSYAGGVAIYDLVSDSLTFMDHQYYQQSGCTLGSWTNQSHCSADWGANNITAAKLLNPTTSGQISAVKGITGAIINGTGYVAVTAYSSYKDNRWFSWVTVYKDNDPTYRTAYTSTENADVAANGCSLAGTDRFDKAVLTSDGNLYVASMNAWGGSYATEKDMRLLVARNIQSNSTGAYIFDGTSYAFNATTHRTWILGDRNQYSTNVKFCVSGPGTWASHIGYHYNPNIDKVYDTATVQGTNLAGGSCPASNTVVIGHGAGATVIEDCVSNTTLSKVKQYVYNTPAHPSFTGDRYSILTKENAVTAVAAAKEEGNPGNVLVWLGQATDGIYEVSLNDPANAKYHYTTTSDIGLSSNKINTRGLSYGTSLAVASIDAGTNRLAKYAPLPEQTVTVGDSDSNINDVKDLFAYDTTKDTLADTSWKSGAGKSWSTIKAGSFSFDRAEGNPVVSTIVNSAGGAPIHPAVVKGNDGKYRMWYGNLAINYSESNDGITNWTAPQLIDLLIVDPYNAARSGYPTVIYENGAYHMWFEAVASGGGHRIMHSTSTNGITGWSVPAIAINQDWVGGSVTAPSAVKFNNQIWLCYGNLNQTGIGCSTATVGSNYDDSTSWIPNSGNPMVTPATNPASWDDDNIMEPSLYVDTDLGGHDALYMLYTGYAPGNMNSFARTPGQIPINTNRRPAWMTGGLFLNQGGAFVTATDPSEGLAAGPAFYPGEYEGFDYEGVFSGGTIMVEPSSNSIKARVWYTGLNNGIFGIGYAEGKASINSPPINFSGSGRISIIARDETVTIEYPTSGKLVLQNPVPMFKFRSVYAVNGVVMIGGGTQNTTKIGGILWYDLKADKVYFIDDYNTKICQNNGADANISGCTATSTWVGADVQHPLIFNPIQYHSNNIYSGRGTGVSYVTGLSGARIQNSTKRVIAATVQNSETGISYVRVFIADDGPIETNNVASVLIAPTQCLTAARNSAVCNQHFKKAVVDSNGNLYYGSNTPSYTVMYRISDIQNRTGEAELDGLDAGFNRYNHLTSKRILADNLAGNTIKDIKLVEGTTQPACAGGTGNAIVLGMKLGVTLINDCPLAASGDITGSTVQHWAAEPNDGRYSAYGNVNYILHHSIVNNIDAPWVNAVAYSPDFNSKNMLFIGQEGSGVASIDLANPGVIDGGYIDTLSTTLPLPNNNVRVLGIGQAMIGNNLVDVLGIGMSGGGLQGRVTYQSLGDTDGDFIRDTEDYCPLPYQRVNGRDICYINRYNKIISSGGDSLTTLDGKLSITFPSGAFQNDTEISVLPAGTTTFQLGTNVVPAVAYTFLPSGGLGGLITVRMYYTAADLTSVGIADENTLIVKGFSDGNPLPPITKVASWNLCLPSEENCAVQNTTDTVVNGFSYSGYIEFKVSHFSDYALVGPVTSPTINAVDGSSVLNVDGSGVMIDLLTPTPAFAGIAPANSQVDLYAAVASGTAPSISKATGESDLSITYTPPSQFSDGFETDSIATKWNRSLQAYIDSGKAYIPAVLGSFLRSTNEFAGGSFDLSADISMPQSMVTDPNSARAAIGVVTQGGSQFGSRFNASLFFTPGGSNVTIDLASGSNTPYPLVFDQTYNVRFVYDASAGTASVYINNSLVTSANVVWNNEPVVIDISGSQGSGITVDNFVSGYSTPSGYFLARTALELGGVSYTGNVMGGSGPSVLWLGAGDPVLLPDAISVSELQSKDIYTYLINISSSLYITSYSAKTPAEFAQLVVGFGGAISVDAFAKVFTYNGGDNTYTPVSLPIMSEGTISADGTIGSGGSINNILIASAMSDSNGNWMAAFGIDSNGVAIPALTGKTLLDLSSNPFTVLAKVGDIASGSVVFNVAVPPVITDTTPPVTTATVAGTLEAAPYGNYYINQATVTLAATDDMSGVAKIEYSLSGATTLALTTYTAPIVITSKGATVVTFKATDVAGNAETAQIITVSVDKDTDSDGIHDNFDKCPSTAGVSGFDGCPNAIKMPGDLHIVYSGTDTGYAGIDDKGKQKNSIKIPLKPGAVGDSRGENVDSVVAKVYTLAALQTQLGADGFDKKLKDQCASIFDSTAGVNEKSLTVNPDVIGVPGVSNYVLAVRTSIYDSQDNMVRSATVCRKVNADKFKYDTKTAEQKLKFMKTVKNKCKANDPKKICIQFDPADETVLEGSMLSITAPEEARWEEGVTNYIYPYVFESDSEWTLDVCQQAPSGYQVAGIYDELGNFIAGQTCAQTVVAGVQKVIAFEIIDVGSPKVFDVTTTFTIKHKGGTQKIEKKISSKVKPSSELMKKKNGGQRLDLTKIKGIQKPAPVKVEKKSIVQKAVDAVKKLFKK